MVAQREHGNRPWLPGYCESASIYGAACESAASVRKGAAAKGSWQLGSARDCIMRCSACPQCAFVSYSREEEDCSWYTSRHAAKQVADLYMPNSTNVRKKDALSPALFVAAILRGVGSARRAPPEHSHPCHC